jgi:alkanesulfonate monooxygenase SsuD/methylene tetrahydromethanopterin reductase-like flavin-dependent oxidoreductase (luciferase family)
MEELMKFGLDVPTTGAYADARVQAQLALEAQTAGWDGFFVWDVLLGDEAVIDPWIALTAIALSTSSIKIGLLALPLARHRPWLTALRLANLDQVSGGRVVCIAGLGHSERDFAAFGDASVPEIRAKQLDEGLQILAGLWTQDPFSFAGEYYTVNQVTLPTKPVQSPRIPLWVVGGWPRRAPFRRAARWDGICLKAIHHQTREWLTLDEFRAALSYVQAYRTSTAPFEVVMSGETPLDQQEAGKVVRPFQEAGATWWIEGGYGFTLDEFRERIRSGPPQP